MRAGRNMALTPLRIVVLLATPLFFAGCSVMDSFKSAATEMTTSAPPVGPYDPPQPTVWESQSQPAIAVAPIPTPAQAQPVAAAGPAATPTLPPPRKPERLPEPSYTPVKTVQPVVAAPRPVSTPPKGAEKLMTLNPTPAMPVHARELSPADQNPVNTQATETAMLATSSGELIFKGPPRSPQAGPGIVRWMILSIFVGLALAGCVFAYLQVQRKAAIAAAAPPPKEKPIEGLEMKEPAGHSPDTVLEA